MATPPRAVIGTPREHAPAAAAPDTLAFHRAATGGATNPLKGLLAYGQSPWMDYIRRDLFTSAQLQKYIDSDGLRGMTSNPAIFEKAIVESDEYDDQLTALIEQGKPPMEIYETIAVEDVQAACDVFRPLFDRLGGRDGFVSLEVSPYIARDTKARSDHQRG